MHDADARTLYELAGHDPEEPRNILRLARDLGLDLIHGFGLRAARLRGHEIHVPWRARGPRLAFLVAHEVAEWWLARTSYRGEDIEARADAIAARLVAPAPAVRRYVAHYGPDLHAIAAALVTTQSVIALRLGEVCGTPTALVGNDGVRVRGEPWGWPADVHALVHGPLPWGVERVPLTDSRRVVLRAV